MRFVPILLKSLVLFVGIAAGLLIVAILVIWQEWRTEQAVLAREGRSAVELLEQTLVQDFQSIYTDLEYLSHQTWIVAFASGDAETRPQLERELIGFASAKRIYDQIRFIDLEGMERIRINFNEGNPEPVASEHLQDKRDRYYIQFSRDLSSGEIFVSAFDLNQEHGRIERPLKPVIRFVAPIFDREDRRRGWLVLNYLGANILERLEQLSNRFAGGTLLLNGNGEYLSSADANQAWGWMLGHDENFREHHPHAWKQMEQRPEGQIRTSENLFTFARFQPGSVDTGQQSVEGPGPGAYSNQIYLVSRVSLNKMSASGRRLLYRLLLFWLVTLPPLALISYFFIRSREIRHNQAAELKESEHRLRQLSTQLLNAQESERKKIARDLHDQFGQQITAIIIDLESTRDRVSDPESHRLIERLTADARAMLATMHQTVKNLRPTELDDLPLENALQSLAEDFKGRQQLDVATQINSSEPLPLSPRVKEQLFRVAQESLSNVASHAQTDSATLILQRVDNEVELQIKDQGVGFNSNEEGSGFGLLGIRERVELLHGEFHLESEADSGTTILVRVPLDPPSDNTDTR